MNLILQAIKSIFMGLTKKVDKNTEQIKTIAEQIKTPLTFDTYYSVDADCQIASIPVSEMINAYKNNRPVCCGKYRMVGYSEDESDAYFMHVPRLGVGSSTSITEIEYRCMCISERPLPVVFLYAGTTTLSR